MTTETPIINSHNKAEYPPMHTAEHILNATMVKMFGCPRSKNAHIEKKKSKCDYILSQEPSAEQVNAIETKVNEVIGQNLPVTVEYMTQQEAASIVDLSKLPSNATDTLRIVRVGDYDACACAGTHVENTSEIGKFKIISASYTAATEEMPACWRVRFKLEQ
jgi:alanyl-tRNA synthetase